MDIWLSPSGNDNNSGLSKKDPLRTPHAAALLARNYAGKEPVNIICRGGYYFLNSTLKLTEQDSGTPDKPITWKAYKDEKPIFSGGIPISNWQQETINGIPAWSIYREPIKQNLEFHRSIWVNDKRIPRASIPKPPNFYQIDFFPGGMPDHWSIPVQSIGYKKGISSIHAFPDSDEVEVLIFSHWAEARCPIRTVEESLNIIYLDLKTTYRPAGPINERFKLENSIEFLTQPEEFTCQQRTGKITYTPTQDQTPQNTTTIIGILTYIAHLENVSNVIFQNISFQHNNYWYVHFKDNSYVYDTEPPASWRSEYIGRGGCEHNFSPVRGAVELKFCQNITFSYCSFEHTHSSGLFLWDGCQYITIDHCLFNDIGCTPIRINSYTEGYHFSWGTVYERLTQNITISNNTIQYFNQLISTGAAIQWYICPYLTITHNEIKFGKQSGIFCLRFIVPLEVGNDNIEISYNHIHHIESLTNDLGLIYLAAGKTNNFNVHHNYLHHISRPENGIDCYGVYLDAGCSNVNVYSNIIAFIHDAAYLQNFDNVYPNHFYRNLIYRPGKMGAFRKGYSDESFISSNVVVLKESYYAYAGDWKIDHIKADYNTYFHLTGHTILFPGNRTLDQWKAIGKEPNSIIADPLLIDPENGNFHLLPNSPALQLGYEDWNYESTGPS
jgi:hypothetical protein